ncbi:lysosomal-associated transmembrane protein 4B-like isoform X1 [Branchiostoma floridae]|uniref:Lysosomal-associated transmembrane protein 4B-like isoform X1 n=1 Tax=Branchiostoma floridae TaxID=7739 RepID=A0A9J7MAI0_BRAFL|nr:lysosomal-associated transmembrane protein 4B-like isoform X1 [Branchiostoma floridae]XP_035697634.1 lysosomal-associated transmembrane protein 4B-like isoform X1 [Branchiostoma floridae]
MAVLNRCCCCLKIRTGSLVTGIFFLAIAIIDLILRAVGLGNVPGVLAGGIVFDIIFAIMCILLIVGVLKDIKWFCLAWVIYAVVYLIILLILAIVYTVMTVAEYIDDDKGVSLGAMIGGLVISWLIVTIVVSFIVYCVLCVYSHYQNLRDGIVEGDVTVTRTEVTKTYV